jgi:Gram-negative bacterial TonB protein C-terminal
MKLSIRILRTVTVLAGLLAGVFQNGFSQNAAVTDSVIRAVMENQSLTGDKQQGVNLIKQDKLTEANQYYNEEIKKNENDRQAFFGRGVVHWAQNEQADACRDWSAVVALGDTTTLKLLDKNCHGKMVIEGDTIPAKRYHQMFGKTKEGSKQGGTAPVVFAEVMPAFPGGDRALFDYLTSHVKYPAKAKEMGIQGTAYITFIVSSKGKIVFPHAERHIGGGCEEELIRVVKSMPLWNPGKQGGKAVAVKYTLPYKFKMKEEFRKEKRTVH